MTTITRNNETIKIESNKTELYKSCGWIVITDLFSFKNKEEQDAAWMERFGN